MFYNKTLLLFFMKFCIKSDETTFERRGEKKGKILAKTHLRPHKMVLCPYKNFGKRIPQTHRLTEFLKPTETLLSSRIQKKQKPLIITRAKKMVRPQWWKVAFSALTRCEGPPGWQRTRCIIVPTVLRGAERIRRMIYIARARREDVFLLVFFLYSWRGVHQCWV